MNRILVKKIILPIITFLIAWLGSLSTSYSDWSWYESLNKPPFNPPNYLFGIVWPVLYVLMAIVSYLNAQKIFILYIMQIILNGLWSWLFFVLQSTAFAFLNIVLLIFLNVLILKQIRQDKAWVSVLLYSPYLIWICFASILNLAIIILN
tara:strand:- start:590 stop:1039 length:450 start_codon:yes stop_codon:yes gene_type:complete